MGEVVETLIGGKPSASTVSRVFQSLESEYEQWKTRALAARSVYALADGTSFTVIYHGEEIERLFGEVKRRSQKMATAFRNERSCLLVLRGHSQLAFQQADDAHFANQATRRLDFTQQLTNYPF